jgi:hypothetical protein
MKRPRRLRSGREGPPQKGSGPSCNSRAHSLPRIRFSAEKIPTPSRRASIKAPHVFAAILAQALGECLTAIIAVDSTSTQVLLGTYSRALRAMTSAKRASRRWRRRRLLNAE